METFRVFLYKAWPCFQKYSRRPAVLLTRRFRRDFTFFLADGLRVLGVFFPLLTPFFRGFTLFFLILTTAFKVLGAFLEKRLVFLATRFFVFRTFMRTMTFVVGSKTRQVSFFCRRRCRARSRSYQNWANCCRCDRLVGGFTTSSRVGPRWTQTNKARKRACWSLAIR